MEDSNQVRPSNFHEFARRAMVPTLIHLALLWANILTIF